MKKTIIIRTRFEAIHSWPDCPYEDVAFLKNPHRHEFWVEVEIQVTHNDRDVEFIKAKRELEGFIEDEFPDINLGTTSCEELAEKIMNFGFRLWDVQSVIVLEDGENGAKISKG